MRDIADALGMLPGSLYAHIESKDDLLWEIASAAGDRFFAMIEPIAASSLLTTNKLRDAIRGHVRVITENLDAAAVFCAEWRHLTPRRKTDFVQRRDRYEAIVTQMVQDGVEQGLFGVSDARYATLMLLSTLNSVYQWYRPEGRMTADEVAMMVSEFVFDGLKRRTT